MTSTATTGTGAPSKRELIPLFVGLILSMLLAALNQTLLSTALPTMVGDLHGVDLMLWVITAYILASTISMPVYGKLGDLVGRKKLLLAAIVLFMVGSVFGALAQDMSWLIVGRVIQGLGGGGLIIMAQTIIADVVPARERGKYMGIMGATFAVSSVAGPLLGGWMTEGPGWRWTFWINLPLGLIALAVVARFLHLPKLAGGRPRLDYTGMALLTVAATSTVLVGTWGGSEYAWGSATILGLIATAIVSSAWFVMVERKAAEPMIPMHMFKDRNFNLSTIAGLLTGVAMFGALGYLPTYLQMATGASATVAGLLMVPMMAGMLITSIGTGALVSRTGRYKIYPIAGSVAVTGSLVLLSTMTISTPTWVICSYLALMGLGLGGSMQNLVLIVQNSFPLREVGTATSSNNFFRQIGASLGAGVVGSLFTTRLVALLSERMPTGGATPSDGVSSLTPESLHELPLAMQQTVIESYNDALTPIFLLIAPLVLLAAVLLCFIDEKPLATTLDRDVPTEPLVAEGADETETDASAAVEVTPEVGSDPRGRELTHR